MIYVVLFFLGIYVFLIALTLRYSQAFKTKNKIIDVIEQYDGIGTDVDYNSVHDSIVSHLKAVNVKPKEKEINIVKVSNGDVRNTCYYKVTYSITWNWPFFGYSGKWDITGETKNVKKCNDIIIDKNVF